MYRHVLDARLPQLGEVVRALLEPDGLPAVVGCAAGKDRTGVTIAAPAGALRRAARRDRRRTTRSRPATSPPQPPACRPDDWRHRRLIVDSPPEFMALDASRATSADEHGGARALLRSGRPDGATELDALVERLTEPADG